MAPMGRRPTSAFVKCSFIRAPRKGPYSISLHSGQIPWLNSCSVSSMMCWSNVEPQPFSSRIFLITTAIFRPVHQCSHLVWHHPCSWIRGYRLTQFISHPDLAGWEFKRFYRYREGMLDGCKSDRCRRLMNWDKSAASSRGGPGPFQGPPSYP